MAHADGVRVGKRHAQLAAHGAMILADHVHFAPDILRRLNDPRQNAAGDEIFEFGVEHGSGRWPVVGGQTMIIVELLGRRQCRTAFYGAGFAKMSMIRLSIRHWSILKDQFSAN